MTSVSARLRLLAVLLVLAAGLAAATSSAAATQVRIGRDALLPAGTTLLGGLSGSTPLRVTVTLAPRDPAALSRFAGNVSTPGSADYRHFLTPAQFRRRFGATAAALASVRASLRAHGLTLGPTAANGLSIPVRASAGVLGRAFSVAFDRLRLRSGATAIVNSAAPALDRAIAADVQGVVGLSSLSAPHPLSHRSGRLAPLLGAQRAAPRSSPHVATGGPRPCAAASGAAASQSSFTSDQIASAYNFSGLYRAGDTGQNVTVAVYELEPFDPQDLAAYQSCYGTSATVAGIPVDGGAGTGAGSGEAALDVEQLIGLAPKATLLVYEGPNSSSNAPGAGPYDTFAAIINQDRARVVSVSWGQCEALEGGTDARSEATLFEQAAAQGQTIVSAAGDAGSEDCDTGTGLPDTSLAVDDPGSQPFVTGVGGTTLHAPGPPPSETVWNNGGNVTGLLGLAPGAGGGGNSSLWPMPGYQSGASGSLGVIGTGSSGASCGAAGGYCRQVPDVSANADPFTGYLIYFNGSGGTANAPVGWQGTGGTSGAAPLWAAVIALADASKACAGTSIGFANPALYRVAGTGLGSYFHDVTSGQNDLTGSHGGLYPAHAGYDMATGLGTPDAAALASGLCAHSLRVGSPGQLLSSLHSTVRVQLPASDAPGAGLGFSTTGLPPGLTLNRATGVVAGQPRRTGSFSVRLTVSDRSDDVQSTSFTWLIAGALKLSGLALQGVRTGAPRLGLRVAAARGAPALTQLAITPPAGLRFNARARRLTLSGPAGQRLRYAASLKRGVLAIRLRVPSALASVGLAPGSIIATPSLVGQLRQGHHPILRLKLSATDASRGVTALGSRLRPRS